MNAKVTVAVATQTGVKELGTQDKNLYYLIIETPKGKYNLNVGEKTYKQVKDLTNTQIPIPENKK